jgi:radical SAM enzyme (rSAM/lipoprotein system)
MSVTKIPLRKRIALKLHRKYQSNEKRLHQLNYILWECTLRCNLNCIHCGSDCKKDASVKDMPAKDFFKALDDITPIIDNHKTMIVLTGGEAILRKDIREIGEGLYQREFPWGVVSNGYALNEQKLNLLMDAGMRSITISIDGLEDSHNWLRGNKNSFKNAFNAIKLLNQTENLRYDVVTCVNQKNFYELDKFYKLLLSARVKEWRIFTIFPIGRAKNEPELQLKPRQFKLLFDFIKKVRQEHNIKLNYGCEGFLGNYENEVRDGFFFCRAGINIASILADGSISACPNLRANFIQGNIYKDNFRDIWEHKYEVYRDRSWTKTGICADCEFFKNCEGNGMHLRDEKTGELLFCHLKKIIEGESMPAHDTRS